MNTLPCAMKQVYIISRSTCLLYRFEHGLTSHPQAILPPCQRRGSRVHCRDLLRRSCRLVAAERTSDLDIARGYRSTIGSDITCPINPIPPGSRMPHVSAENKSQKKVGDATEIRAAILPPVVEAWFLHLNPLRVFGSVSTEHDTACVSQHAFGRQTPGCSTSRALASLPPSSS